MRIDLHFLENLDDGGDLHLTKRQLRAARQRFVLHLVQYADGHVHVRVGVVVYVHRADIGLAGVKIQLLYLILVAACAR